MMKPLLPSQAECEALKLKWVMRDGKAWERAPHILTRTPDGQLRDRPAMNQTEEAI